jgi:uncharacterized membrane protein YfcA
MGVLALISCGGVIAAYMQNNLDFSVAAPYTLGSVVGLLVGRLIAKQFKSHHIQISFAIFTFLVSISLLQKGISEWNWIEIF